MSDVKKYTVLADGNIAQRGKFLPKGSVIELEEHIAHTEFANRVAEEGSDKPVERWEESNAALSAFDIEMKKAGLRAHERVQLLSTRKKVLSQQLDEVSKKLEVAEGDLKKDEAAIQQKHAALAARTKPAAADSVPSK